MKNTKLFALTALLVAVLFTGCKNDLVGTATVKGDGITCDKQLNINITSDDNIRIFNTDDTSRTLLTDAFAANGSGDNELKFYIWGNSTTSETLAPKAVTVTPKDAISGTVMLDIEALNWDLTLACVLKSDTTGATPAVPATPTEAEIRAAAVLIGYANVDMQFTNTINFTLSPKGLTKTGNIALKIQKENDWVLPAGYTAKASIYNAITMEPVEVTAATPPADAYEQAITFISYTADVTGAGVTPNYSVNNVAPGTYIFEVRFTNDYDNRKYVWNDTLIVLPGKTTDSITKSDGTLSKAVIIPNLIGKRPVSPKDCIVEYVADSEDFSPDMYKAKFKWNGDDVKTEKNFVIELAELAEGQTTPAAVNKDTWSTLWTDSNKKYTFDYDALNNATKSDGTDLPNPNYEAYYNRFRDSGSILANSTEITLKLELGKRYIARMYSENNSGYSNVSETDASKTADELASYFTIAKVTTTEAVNTKTEHTYIVINRYRLTYYKQSYTAYWQDGAISNAPTKIFYWGQCSTSYPILVPTGDGTAGNLLLTDGAAKWYYWMEDPQNPSKYDPKMNVTEEVTPYTPNNYEGFKNLDLYAAYSRQGNLEIYDDRNYELNGTWISAFGTDNPSKTTSITYSKGTNTTSTVSVTLPTLPVADQSNSSKNWVYDKVIFQLTYGGKVYVSQEAPGAGRGTANEFTVELKYLPTGCVYNGKITAHYKQTIVSYPFTVYITD